MGLFDRRVTFLASLPFSPLLQSSAAKQGRIPFPRRFVVPLASGAIAGVGGGESIESMVDPFSFLAF